MPGQFMPGEAEKAAEHLGVPWDEFKKQLIKTYHWSPETDPLIWMPRKTDTYPGLELADDDFTNETGTCVFLKDDRCSIHPVKPWCCRIALLCKGNYGDVWGELNRAWAAMGGATDAPYKGSTNDG